LKRNVQLSILAVAVAASAVSIVACGGGDDNKSSTTQASTTPKGPTTVNVSLGEYFIKLDRSSIPSGQVRFSVKNDGKIKHEFVVLRTNIAPGKLPLNSDGEANEEIAESPGEIPGIASGKSRSLDVVLKPGKYVLLCNLPGHYKAGQYTGTSVK
jgi:uncharacterized cupredoxin-like copper-binding protein